MSDELSEIMVCVTRWANPGTGVHMAYRYGLRASATPNMAREWVYRISPFGGLVYGEDARLRPVSPEVYAELVANPVAIGGEVKYPR